MSRWSAPADPDCPIISELLNTFWNDPMTTASGVGDEVADDIERNHIANCQRCQEYGAANIEVKR
jgi:hypothetical protein